MNRIRKLLFHGVSVTNVHVNNIKLGKAVGHFGKSDLAKLEYQFGFKNLAQAEPKF